MSKQKSHLQEMLERHQNIPLPPEYKKVFFDYIRLFHKWMSHINRALDNVDECEQMATTAAAIKKASEMREYVSNVCWMRDGILVMISLFSYIGMTIPNTKTLEDFKTIYEIIDENILLYLAILQRYQRAIKNHTRLSLKGLTMPITFGDIQRMEEFPNSMIMDAAFVNGQHIMGICSTKKGQ